MRRHVRVTWAAVLVITLLLARPAGAWNGHGHMLVAFLAYQQLNAAERAKADALVQLNPLFHQWQQVILSVPTSTLPAASRSAMLFAIAATWPDIIKTDTTHHDDGPDNGDRPPTGPSASRNTGYGDAARHKYWHFDDQPFTRDGSHLPAVPVPNAVDRIGVLRMTLASTGTSLTVRKLKSYDLVWLLHLVGDIHQPLHAATRVGHSQPDGDHGGNLVKLVPQCATCPDELHAFWDGILGSGDALSANPTTRNAAIASVLHTTIAVATGAAATELNPQKWADESLSLAKSNVYVSPIGDGAGPFTVTSAYSNAAKTTATARIALAAARLANILKADLQ
jgi:hypothetical protein